MVQGNRKGIDQQNQEIKRGRLTIFLGAMSGVGKTYAMLRTAHERLEQEVRPVIGWIDTHECSDIQCLAKDIPDIPPRLVVDRERTYKELNLEAILALRPELVLIEDLAHTNPPGFLNSRRYQDVEVLLQAGINVFTTLNIQHIESLRDVFTQITGLEVSETVPDRILERAHEIKLIDISPDELLERINEGKVKLSHQDKEQKLYRQGNINALREIALRYAAQRIDSQLEEYRKAHEITCPWPSHERFLACISPSPFSAQVIRSARRMATGLKADLVVTYVETHLRSPATEEEREKLADNLHLAEELGAEVITLSGHDVAEELLDLAKRKNITQIVIGKPRHSRLRELWQGSVVDRIVRGSQGMSVHIIPGNINEKMSIENVKSLKIPLEWPYVLTFLLVAFITVLNKLIGHELVNIALLYLLPVLFSAAYWGRGPSILASLLGVLSFDIFFVPPFLSITVDDLKYLLSFAVFLLVAVITGTLATRLRGQAEIARRRETRTSALYALSRKIVVEADLDAMLNTIVRVVSETIGGETVIFLPDGEGNLVRKANTPSLAKDTWNQKEIPVALWVFEQGHLAGKGTETIGDTEGLYLPLRTEEKILGILGVKPGNPEKHLSPEQRQLLEAFANLAALAIMRLQLEEEARQVRCLAQSEKLRTALFNSISHELRTPLASIKGAVTGLLEGGDIYNKADRRSLLQTVYEGAVRMNRLVGNLLDMARLESGMMQLKYEWWDLEEIIGVALRQIQESIQDRPININSSSSVVLVKGDFALIEQVLVNLLDNACKYSPSGSEISITTRKFEREIHVSVSDCGSGIPGSDWERVFDKFHRLYSPQHIGGTGLGLSISKGIIEAHGGRIWVSSNDNGGCTFTFSLPLDEEFPKEIPPVKVVDRDE